MARIAIFCLFLYVSGSLAFPNVQIQKSRVARAAQFHGHDHYDDHHHHDHHHDHHHHQHQAEDLAYHGPPAQFIEHIPQQPIPVVDHHTYHHHHEHLPGSVIDHGNHHHAHLNDHVVHLGDHVHHHQDTYHLLENHNHRDYHHHDDFHHHDHHHDNVHHHHHNQPLLGGSLANSHAHSAAINTPLGGISFSTANAGALGGLLGR